MKGPLEGLTISLCGTFNQIHGESASTPFQGSHVRFDASQLTRACSATAALAVDIDNLGGKYSSIIDFSVTHLVATEKIYRSNGAKSELIMSYLAPRATDHLLSLLL